MEDVLELVLYLGLAVLAAEVVVVVASRYIPL